ncbi:P-loop containing nucleoside triphosphate hydrolase protein [Auriculariales sp. MPI-PUGE-AT-0066]|nr:P-loop containing nucleoside triphosphate hydrolase protein [Auriculariales sp. MPI-PUGE-AT-0066]
MSSTVLLGGSLVIALLAVLIAVLFARRSASKRGTDILLVGPSDAGKTALLSALLRPDGRAAPSHTSMLPNVAFLPAESSKTRTRAVDIPGHPRLRTQGLQDHVGAAKAVVFVVDASTIARNGAAVAEHLHLTLSTLAALPNTPPVAVVAAKCDLAGASTTSGVTRVRTVLERELDKRRASRVDVEGVGLGMETADDGTGNLGGLETVGAPGTPFRLAEWEGGEIAVLGCSVTISGPTGEKEEASEKDGLIQVREWIEALE